MPDTGTQLGVELYELQKAAKVDVPALVDAFLDARVAVGKGGDISAVFAQPGEFGSPRSTAYEPWIALRDRLEEILNETATNLDLVADALMLAVGEYARADSRAAQELNNRRHDLGEPVYVPPAERERPR